MDINDLRNKYTKRCHGNCGRAHDAVDNERTTVEFKFTYDVYP